MKDMCADCGADLRNEESGGGGGGGNDPMTDGTGHKVKGTGSGQGEKSNAAIAMVHSIPELKVSNDVISNNNAKFGTLFVFLTLFQLN